MCCVSSCVLQSLCTWNISERLPLWFALVPHLSTIPLDMLSFQVCSITTVWLLTLLPFQCLCGVTILKMRHLILELICTRFLYQVSFEDWLLANIKLFEVSFDVHHLGVQVYVILSARTASISSI